MKLTILLALSMFFIGCNKKEDPIVTHSTTTVVETETVEVNPQVNIAEKFAGRYFMPFGGEIELSSTQDGLVDIRSSYQNLQSENPKNNTLGTHPRVLGSLLRPHNGVILLERNDNYSSSTHDLEEDVSGSNITGRHRTTYKFESYDNGKCLRITIEIYGGAINSNINNVIAKRILEGC